MGGDLQILLGVAAGLIAGRFVKNMVATLDPKIMAALQAAAGWFISGMGNPLVKGAGYGLFGNGALSLAQSFNLVGMPTLYPRLGAPAQNVTPLISGAGYDYSDDPELGRSITPDVALISGIYGDEYTY
jgi:hypothetical protein